MGNATQESAAGDSASPSPNTKAGRGLRNLTFMLLAAALLATFATVWDFGQTRFFTVDEYQWGHLTWLMTTGAVPYVDFYEHHFPLSYLLHALLLPDDGSFGERALWFRSVAFGYLLAMSGVLAFCGNAVTRNPFSAWLLAFLPIGFGFSLMSAIEYRADNFSTCVFVACLALLEVDRSNPRRWRGLACGALLATSILMTQKMVVLAGGSVALLFAIDLVRGRGARKAGGPLIAQPLALFATAAVVGGLALATAGVFGVLPSAWEATVVHAVEHESHYPAVGFGQYLNPFLAETRFTTWVIAAFAVAFVALARNPIWAVPLLVTIAAGSMMKAQFPYNYVYAGYLVVICAVRGYANLVELPSFPGRAATWKPLLYLLPLALLPDQLDYVSGRTSNGDQLRLLQKIEAYSDAGDAVIDGAGGALFRQHGSYYWYHGDAHRKMFHEYFSDQLVQDYRASQALFWIHDFRQQQLPMRVKSWFTRHYVHVDGDLFALGFTTATTGKSATERRVDIIREADYYVLTATDTPQGRVVSALRPGKAAGLKIDGAEVSGGTVHLTVGRHLVESSPRAPEFLITPVPATAFQPSIGGRDTHSPLFEFEIRPAARMLRE